MPIPAVNLPSAVAYFNVFVPVGSFGSLNSRDDARRIVDRYLYGDFDLLEVVLADEEDGEPANSYRVSVRGTFYNGALVLPDHWVPEFPLQRVQQQRDRFASGLYATSEPVILTPFEG